MQKRKPSTSSLQLRSEVGACFRRSFGISSAKPFISPCGFIHGVSLKGEMQMENYQKMYYELFNKVTDIIESLKKIQQESEETFITSNDAVTAVTDN